MPSDSCGASQQGQSSYTPVLAGILSLLYSSQLGDMRSEPQLTRYVWHNFTVKAVGTDGETPAAFLLDCMFVHDYRSSHAGRPTTLGE
jgi:hypothetical protein